MAAASIATGLVGGIGLRTDFRFQGDRFSHVVSLIGRGESPIPLLESVEGTAAEAWPASPPLQSLHVETLPDGRRAALLVGMAGRGHWSASIEALPDAAAFVFDIACRTADPASALMSSYRLAAPGAAALLAAADESWIEVRHMLQAFVISPERGGPAPAALQTIGKSAFAIAPRPQKGTTIRWKYRIELLTPVS